MNRTPHYPNPKSKYPVTPMCIDVAARVRRNWTLNAAFPSFEMEWVAFLIVSFFQTRRGWAGNFTLAQLQDHAEAHGFPWAGSPQHFEGLEALASERFVIRVGEDEYLVTCEFILACFAVAPVPNLALRLELVPASR